MKKFEVALERFVSQKQTTVITVEASNKTGAKAIALFALDNGIVAPTWHDSDKTVGNPRPTKVEKIDSPVA
jgi:hypothetical protein